MPSVIVTRRDGETVDVPFTPGASLMQTLCEGGIDEILALCGGVCSCGTCHVYIEQSPVKLPPVGTDEDLVLDSSSHRTDRSRLACQIRLSPEMDGLRLTVAPEDL